MTNPTDAQVEAARDYLVNLGIDVMRHEVRAALAAAQAGEDDEIKRLNKQLSVLSGEYRKLSDEAEVLRAAAQAGVTEWVSEDEVKNRLAYQIGVAGGLRAWCRANNVTCNSHVSEFLNGIRGAPSDMLAALGLENAIRALRPPAAPAES